MTQRPTRAQILNKFANIVSVSLHIDAARVTESAYLDDLGVESLDLIEITMGVEDAFNVWISEKSILQTAREVFGPGVLERDGVLQEAGKALLLARMPELDPACLEGRVAAADINRHLMRVSGWVRMIDLMLAASPMVCPQCTGELGPAVAFKRKCKQCGSETPLVSGEEINRQWVLEYQASLASQREAVPAGAAS